MKQIMRVLACVLIFAAGQLSVAQPSPAVSQRVRSIVTALNAPPDQFEQFAQEHYTAAYLGTQTPAQRRDFIERVQRELGRIEPSQLMREGPSRIAIGVYGSKGKAGTIVFEHQPETYKIASLELGAAADDPDGPPPAPVRGSMTANELSTALDAHLKTLADEGRLSGVLLVARDGKPVFEKGYNFANRSDSVPNSPATRFHLGSINKDFTKVAIGQLAAAGKLALDDTIGKHLPDHPNADAKRVTIQQLLNHTGGLPGFFDEEYSRAAKSRFRGNREMYDYVAPKKLQFEPGTQEQYCNSCYVVLGEIIATASGMPYERYIERNVFAPAGMRTAGFFQTDEIRPNVATHYTATPNGLRSIVHQHAAGGNAAGGAWATPADLLAFDNAVRDGKLLDPKWNAWFFRQEQLPTGRVKAPHSIAGGAPGINAALISGPTWTVVGTSNFDQRFMENLAAGIYRALQ